PAGAAFVAVELAGKERLERERVARELHHLDLEAVLLGKAAVRRHEHEAGVAFGLHDSVPPGLELLRSCGRCHRGSKRGCEGSATDPLEVRPPRECPSLFDAISAPQAPAPLDPSVSESPPKIRRPGRVSPPPRRGGANRRRRSGDGVWVCRENRNLF